MVEHRKIEIHAHGLTLYADTCIDVETILTHLVKRTVLNTDMKTRNSGPVLWYSAKLDRTSRARLRAWRRLNNQKANEEQLEITLPDDVRSVAEAEMP